MTQTSIPMDVLVLVNSASSAFAEGRELALPYLDHLGLPHTLLDLAETPLPRDLTRYALTVVAHRRLDPRGSRLGPHGRHALLSAVRAGAGLISLDPRLPSRAETGAPRPAGRATAEVLRFAPEPHYITARHEPGAILLLESSLRVPALASQGQAPVTAGGRPLVATARLGRGRVVQWATMAWAHSRILGPLGGLDDAFWRSLVWAARKPFAMRGLAPLVAMRVDDVVGQGRLWNRSPLYWVHAANRHGFKPWLGLFIYNLDAAAVNELRDLVARGRATAFPHAFGRPPRTPDSPFSYYEGALPLRADDCDEFIYFDHQRGRPWSTAEARRGLAAVDDWYAAQAPLPMSHVALPHWYEAGTNIIPHLQDEWGVEFTGQPIDIGERFAAGTPWLKAGPFRRYERPGDCFNLPTGPGSRPVYYAGWLNVAGRRFFNCLTEIRDDAGYEWCPDNDISATAGRGVRQLRRALDSMALPVLFTHETDYIYRIHPSNWEAALAQVTRGIAGYSPVYVTLDEAMRYVRATHTSRLVAASFDPGAGTVSADLRGVSDVETHFYLFTEEGGEIRSRLVPVPPFAGQTSVVASPGPLSQKEHS